jgi:hypothetical protein
MSKKKVVRITANDPMDLKGSLKSIGGSQSDHWNMFSSIKRCKRSGPNIRTTRHASGG